MKKVWMICILLSVVVFSGALAQVSLVKTKINDNLQMKLSGAFENMTESEFQKKYTKSNFPIAAFTDRATGTDLIINASATRWNDIELMKSFYRASITGLFDEITFFKDTLHTINKRTFAILEFIATIKGDPESITKQKNIKKYNLIAYTIINNQAYVFNFNCPLFKKEQQQSLAWSMIKTIKLKGKK